MRSDSRIEVVEAEAGVEEESSLVEHCSTRESHTHEAKKCCSEFVRTENRGGEERTRGGEESRRSWTDWRLLLSRTNGEKKVFCR